MQTEKIKISNNGEGMNDALELTRKTADSIGLTGKNHYYLCLLSEELLGMVRAMVGNFEASFWLESWIEDATRKCKIHLDAESQINYATKQDLIAVSSSKKNAFSFGIMEKVRNIMEGFLYNMEESFKFQSEYGTGMLDYGTLGMTGSEISQAVYSWSMSKYKKSIENQKNNSDNESLNEAWDELEKSIIANIADDVQVGIKDNIISVIILKNF